MDPNLFKSYSTLFDTIEQALLSSPFAEKSIEMYLSKKAPFATRKVSKTTFVNALVDLNLFYKKELIEFLADQLLDRSNNMIDLDQFFSIYRNYVSKDPGFDETGQAIYSVASTVGKDSLKEKALQSLLEYTKKGVYWSSSLKIINEGIKKVVKRIDLRFFFDSNFPELNYEEKEAFFKAYKLPEDPKLIDIEAIEKDLSKIGQTDNIDNILEEVRQAVMATCTNLQDLFKSFDRANSGKLSFVEVETALAKIGKFHSDKIWTLCQEVDKLKENRIRYMDLSKMLEEYSLKKANISPTIFCYPFVQQIRAFIKEHSENSMEIFFQKVETSYQDNKQIITFKNFKECLAKMRIFPSDLDLDKLCLYFDPKNISHIDFAFLCEKIGYIQPPEKHLQRPMTGGGYFQEKPGISGKQEDSVNIDDIVQKAYIAFERHMKENRIDSLRIFLSNWDDLKAGRLAKSHIKDIFNNFCRLNVSEIEINAIIKRYNKTGSGVVFIDAIEKDFNAYLEKKNPTANSREFLGKLLQKYCEEKKVRPEAIFSQYYVANGIISSKVFQSACKEVLGSAISDGLLSEAVRELQNYRGEVNITSFINKYARRVGEDQIFPEQKRILSILADKLLLYAININKLLVSEDIHLSGFIRQDQLQTLLTNTLHLSIEEYSTLNQFLKKYDPEQTGSIRYEPFYE